MKKEQIAVQLFCFREAIKTPSGLENTLKRLNSFGYSCVQLTTAIPQELSVDELKAILAETGMTAVSSHEKSDAFFNAPQEIIAKLKALGLTHTAYPWPHIMPADHAGAVGFAKKLNDIAKMFKANGITLAYHNHAREFVKFNGKTLLDIIFENAPEIDAEIDTFWVHKGGGSVTDMLLSAAGRTGYLHIKDYGTVYNEKTGTDAAVMMPIGSGNLNWEKIFAAAESAGVKYYIVEHDADVTDPFDSFKKSFDFLAENFAE